ncbi:MAG: hypothetical protein K2L14_02750 [Duncaniella sp.]|nr:hypothetical protein [Duncaniella sp.]
MIKLLTYFDRFAAMLLAVVLLVMPSCRGDIDDETLRLPSDGSVSVGFTLVVSDTNQSASSRAQLDGTPSDGTYDPGSGYENYIDIAGGDFRFYFFSNTDKYLGTIDIVSIFPIDAAGTTKTYTVVGKVPEGLESLTEFKVCVLANWKKYPELTAGASLSTLWSLADETVYKFAGSGALSETSTIPLYGIKQFSGVKFEPDTYVDLKRVHLLRAYAKLEVNIASVDPVKTVSLTRVNPTGYKAPAGVNTESKYVSGSYESDYVDKPHIPTLTGGAEVLTDIPMQLVSVDDGIYKYIIYLPEYDNCSAGAVPARIRLDYEDSKLPSSYVDFKYYKPTGSHAKDEKFDILRNYWYRFNVYIGTVMPSIEVDVIPYTVRYLAPNFGVEPTYPMPDELYIVGDIEGRSFSPDRGFLLERDPVNNLFVGEVELNGDFWFVTGLNTELEPDRFYSHGNQLGVRIYTKISYHNTVFITYLDEPEHIGLSDNTSQAVYKVTVDWNSMEVHIETPDEIMTITE